MMLIGGYEFECEGLVDLIVNCVKSNLVSVTMNKVTIDIYGGDVWINSECAFPASPNMIIQIMENGQIRGKTNKTTYYFWVENKS